MGVDLPRDLPEVRLRALQFLPQADRLGPEGEEFLLFAPRLSLDLLQLVLQVGGGKLGHQDPSR